MAVFARRHQVHEVLTAPRDTTNAALRRSNPYGRENRKLALMLASVAAAVFVMVVILVFLFHYAEVHHSLAMLGGSGFSG